MACAKVQAVNCPYYNITRPDPYTNRLSETDAFIDATLKPCSSSVNVLHAFIGLFELS